MHKMNAQTGYARSDGHTSSTQCLIELLITFCRFINSETIRKLTTVLYKSGDAENFCRYNFQGLCRQVSGCIGQVLSSLV